jgi:hypothetical protein
MNTNRIKYADVNFVDNSDRDGRESELYVEVIIDDVHYFLTEDEMEHARLRAERNDEDQTWMSRFHRWALTYIYAFK